MKLRFYQQQCIDAIFKALKFGDRALVSLPVGSGKTIVFIHLIEKILKYRPNFRAIVLINRNILIDQTREKFKIDVGVFSAGYGEKNLQYPITIASIQSLMRCKVVPKVDCLLIDEYHSMPLDKGCGKIIYEKLNKPKVIAFTATPFLPDGELLYGKGKFFKKEPCCQSSLKQMTDNGFMAPLILTGQKEKTKYNLDSVERCKNDYNLIQLEKAILSDNEKIYLQIEDTIEKTKYRKKVAILCVSINHCEMVYKKLIEQNQSSSILHSKMTDKQQIANRKEFMTGNSKFIVSVMMLTTGWDMPALDTLVIYRPTRSYVLFMQSVGRVVRKFKGKKNGLILDYGNIIENLGSPYHLRLKKKPKKEDTLKMCVECYVYNKNDAKKCKNCGSLFKLMCPFCLEMKLYGESCTCGHKVKRNPFNNLTLSAYEETYYLVDHVKIVEHITKKGRKLPRIDYYEKVFGFNKKIVSEYIFNLNFDKTKELFKQPKYISLYKNSNGYMNIKNKVFEDKKGFATETIKSELVTNINNNVNGLYSKFSIYGFVSVAIFY